MPGSTRSFLHLTRSLRGASPTDAFGSSNVFERLLDNGWIGEIGCAIVEDKEGLVAKSPMFSADFVDARDFSSWAVDLVILEGGVNPIGWNDWRIPPNLLVTFVESGGIALALDVDKGRLKSAEQRREARFFGAHIDPEGSVPYIADGHETGLNTVFDLIPTEMLVSPWLQDAYQGVPSVHVRAAVPVSPIGDIAISSSHRARQLKDDLFEPGMGPFPFGTVVNHGKGYAVGVFAHMTTDQITDEHPENTTWVANLIEIVTSEAQRRRRLLSGKLSRHESPADLLSVIVGGESNTVEFKTSLGWNVPAPDPSDRQATAAHEDQLHQFVKSVAAFLNSDGGTLIVGVRDDQHVTGIQMDLNTYKGSRDRLVRVATEKLIRSLDDAALGVRLSVEQVAGNEVLVCRTPRSDHPVFAKNLKGRLKGKEIFWVRVNNQIEELTGTALANYLADRFERRR